MIQTLKNGEGYIYALIEYLIVDHFGHLEDNGKYCNVRYYWVHKKHRHDRLILPRLIKKMEEDERTNFVEYIYWVRNWKYPNRKPKMFTRETCLRFTNILGGL